MAETCVNLAGLQKLVLCGGEWAVDYSEGALRSFWAAVGGTVIDLTFDSRLGSLPYPTCEEFPFLERLSVSRFRAIVAFCSMDRPASVLAEVVITQRFENTFDQEYATECAAEVDSQFLRSMPSLEMIRFNTIPLTLEEIEEVEAQTPRMRAAGKIEFTALGCGGGW
uniref:Uncharacterized protein n=1 Tax=Mycena chlorophos TaxID=658473 RepID=A0ABQ0KUU6_MYCCL|nr:predicted protein [Mycena chlorophos]